MHLHNRILKTKVIPWKRKKGRKNFSKATSITVSKAGIAVFISQK